MGAVGLGVKGGFGFGRVVAALQAIQAISRPRTPPEPTQRTMELTSVAGAGLVGAGHSDTVIVTPSVPNWPGPVPKLKADVTLCVPVGLFCPLSLNPLTAQSTKISPD
jgi:hypothetical protein